MGKIRERLYVNIHIFWLTHEMIIALTDHCILYACNYFMYTLKQLIATRWL